MTGAKDDGNSRREAIGPQQGVELVRYIRKLTRRTILPTREMYMNFASSVAYSRLRLQFLLSVRCSASHTALTLNTLDSSFTQVGIMLE